MFSCVMFNLQFVQLKVCSIVVCSMLTCSLFNRLCVQLTFVQMLKVQYDFCSIIQMLSYSTFKLLMFNWPFVQLTSCSVVFWSSRICSIIFLFNCFVQKDLFIRPLFNRPGRVECNYVWLSGAPSVRKTPPGWCNRNSFSWLCHTQLDTPSS